MRRATCSLRCATNCKSIIGYPKPSQKYCRPQKPMSHRPRYPSLLLVGALFVGLLLGQCSPLATVPADPSATPLAQPAAPTPASIRRFPGTNHTLQGEFRRFWEQHDGAHALGPPVTAPIWLD